MAERHDQQGTGRHGHKDTQEPWPHTRDEGRRDHHGESHAGQHDAGQAAGSHSREHDRSEEAELKRREYRDEKGEVHHHTRTYMEQHQGDRKGGSDR